LDNLGCEILKEVLEALDKKYRQSQKRKRNWTIVRSNDQKAILTPFGQVIFKRSYYRHKENKRYAYLVDKKIGIKPHARVGENLKAEKGADNMASMRAVKANSESVYEHYLASKEPAAIITELNLEVKRELRRLKKKRLLGKENFNNVPFFNGPDKKYQGLDIPGQK
jgi:hypothetical protein